LAILQTIELGAAATSALPTTHPELCVLLLERLSGQPSLNTLSSSERESRWCKPVAAERAEATLPKQTQEH